jgi:hypothetical protein
LFCFVPEKVAVNQEVINGKLYSHKKYCSRWELRAVVPMPACSCIIIIIIVVVVVVLLIIILELSS